MKKIGIIGAGPAGLMAAAVLLEANIKAEIFLFEKNDSLGQKILLTGGGRCNLTTALIKNKDILEKYTRGGKFLKYALNNFPPKKARQWFLEHNLRTKIEPDNKVYPVSNKAQDVIDVFSNIFKNKKNLKILLNTEIDEKYLHDNKFDYIIIATGGKSREFFGHKITQLAPSLTSFVTQEKWSHELSGLSLENCRLKYGEQYLDGHFLFTHFGISGPAVFSLSSKIAYEDINQLKPYKIWLVIDAQKDFNAWDKILTEKFNESGAKDIKNILGEILPKKLVEKILFLVKIASTKKSAKISKPERQKISKLLSNGLEINLISRRQGAEMVTAGGVDLAQVDSKTCMSKIQPNLFFCGEVLDVDAVTGGFNLQNCWMTGKLVAETIINIIKNE